MLAAPGIPEMLLAGHEHEFFGQQGQGFATDDLSIANAQRKQN